MHTARQNKIILPPSLAIFSPPLISPRRGPPPDVDVAAQSPALVWPRATYYIWPTQTFSFTRLTLLALLVSCRQNCSALPRMQNRTAGAHIIGTQVSFSDSRHAFNSGRAAASFAYSAPPCDYGSLESDFLPSSSHLLDERVMDRRELCRTRSFAYRKLTLSWQRSGRWLRIL